jgi:toxin ParE1/3/4
MINHLIIRPEAEHDISEAYSWYNDRFDGLGTDFLNCINEAFNSILCKPKSYSTVYKEVRRALIQRFPYAVYYIHEETNVVVLAVFHFKRNPKILRKRI